MMGQRCHSVHLAGSLVSSGGCEYLFLLPQHFRNSMHELNFTAHTAPMYASVADTNVLVMVSFQMLSCLVGVYQ
jgi:hypothetical protein